VVIVLFLIGIAVQFFLAGLALFGETDWDAHEELGFTLMHLLSLLAFVIALIGWLPRGWMDIGLSFLVFGLTTLQVALPSIDTGWIAAFHPLLALVLFLLAHQISNRDWRLLRMRELPRTTTPAAVPGNPPA
jgi:hypothetical protein